MATQITIYTDGAARGNPGKGGYGIVLMSGQYRKEISDGFLHTTNNRMELLAVIVALEAIKQADSEITVFTDSKYVVDSIEKKWIYGWVKKGFKNIKNPDLWKRFLIVYKTLNVKFVWIKGHANIKENEVCDRLAVKASHKPYLKEDTGYVNSQQVTLNL